MRWRGIGRSPDDAFRIVSRRVMRQVNDAAFLWVREMNQQTLRVTPLDTGDLRESQYAVRQITMNGCRIETGFKMPYAPVVHEFPNTVNWTTPGTGNKFLERTYFGNAYTLPEFIIARVRL
jgi:hypothetical protein